MKISVIIATYHGEKYIAEQLMSLFHQTLAPDEILIGDDSGDEKTIDEIDRVRNAYSGDLRIIRNPSRLGIIGNYRNLAQQAVGDLIYFCDQDDVWLPQKIEKLAGALETHPDKMAAVCNSETTDKDLNPHHQLFVERTPAFYEFTRRLEQGTWDSFKDIFMQKYIFPAHNMVMKKNMLDLFTAVPEDYGKSRLYHDVWLARIASLAGKLYYLDEILTHYRIHETNSNGFEAPQPESVPQLLALFSRSTAEIEKTAQQLDHIYQVAAQERHRELFPSENLEQLRRFADFFRKRAVLHTRSRFFRPAAAASLWSEYFRYGLGVRSLVRDLLVK